jgi:hypothetical protein
MAAAPATIPAVQRADPSAPVLELPLGISERDTAAVYRSIDYRRPVINGFSGHVPPHYRVLNAALRLNDDAVLAELARDGPIVVVVDHQEQFARWSQLASRVGGEVLGDDGAWRVYQLRPQPRPSTGVDGTPLPIRAVAANVGADWASRMIDGKMATEWNSRRVQAGGEEVVIELDAARDVSALRLSLGPFAADYPRQLSVDCAGERGDDWQECWSGSGAALALRGALDDPHTVALTIPLARHAVRRLRLRQTAKDAENGWSIAEVTVLGR